MITLIDILIKVLFKGLSLAAKVALSRVTIIITFAATISTTFAAIYSSLSDVDSYLSQAVDSVSNLSSTVSTFVSANAYVQMIGYALSLETLVNGTVSTFFWIFCTLGGFLLTALFTVFFSVAPLLAELIVAALKRQYANAASGTLS